MQLELPSPDPNVAPPPVINRRIRYADQPPRPSVARAAAESRSNRQLRALPWIVVMLWAGAMLLGVYAEYLISKAFQ